MCSKEFSDFISLLSKRKLNKFFSLNKKQERKDWVRCAGSHKNLITGKIIRKWKKYIV